MVHTSEKGFLPVPNDSVNTKSRPRFMAQAIVLVIINA